MSKKRLSVEQIIQKLREAELELARGQTVPQWFTVDARVSYHITLMPRQYGVAKYSGRSRIVLGLLDLISVGFFLSEVDLGLATACHCSIRNANQVCDGLQCRRLGPAPCGCLGDNRAEPA